MQWESGRTGHTLLHAVRESKRQTTSGVLSSVFVPPHTGQSSQLSVGANDGNAEFLATLAGRAYFATHTELRSL